MSKTTHNKIFTFFKTIIISDKLSEDAKICLILERANQHPEESLRSLLHQEGTPLRNSLIHIVTNNSFEEANLLQILLELPSRLLLATPKSKLENLSKKDLDFSSVIMTNLKNGHFSPLYYASANNFLLIAQILIKFGADVNGKSLNIGRSPLHIACIKGNENMAEMLIKQGTNLEESQTNGLTPLMLASSYGHLNIVKLLLRFGAKLDHQDQHKFTSLQYAIELGNIEICMELLRYHPDIEIKNKFGRNALDIAEIHGYYDIRDTIMNYASRIGKMSSQEVTPAKSDLSSNILAKSSKSKTCNHKI